MCAALQKIGDMYYLHHMELYIDAINDLVWLLLQLGKLLYDLILNDLKININILKNPESKR